MVSKLNGTVLGVAAILRVVTLCWAGLSWPEHHVPRIIAGAVAVGVSGLSLIPAAAASASGRCGLLLKSAASIGLAVFGNRHTAAASGQCPAELRRRGSRHHATPQAPVTGQHWAAQMRVCIARGLTDPLG